MIIAPAFDGSVGEKSAVVSAPALICFAVVISFTWVGANESVLLPSPSAPASPFPQQNTRPSLISAQA